MYNIKNPYSTRLKIQNDIFDCVNNDGQETQTLMFFWEINFYSRLFWHRVTPLSHDFSSHVVITGLPKHECLPPVMSSSPSRGPAALQLLSIIDWKTSTWRLLCLLYARQAAHPSHPQRRSLTDFQSTAEEEAGFGLGRCQHFKKCMCERTHRSLIEVSLEPPLFSP